ncbi:glycosyltransferase family 9 protein [Luedemannella flava]|uniref:Glycosyltransferase family 9 protein n=1 Tax=Luedemannella flava TaxID=349316 RepID=A0ABP4YLR5_9ACTN
MERTGAIVALRASGLGDLLTAVPALRALRRARPDAELTLAAPAGLAPLVERLRITLDTPAGGHHAAGRHTDRRPADHAVVDHVVDVSVKAPPERLRWLGPEVDVAVNLHGKGPGSTRLLHGLAPGHLWAYGMPDAPPWDPYEHEVARWRRLVEAYGCPTRGDDLYLGSPGHRDGPVLIHPGASNPARRWPADRFATVARGVAEQGLDVRITAGPGEEGLAGDVAVQAGLGPDAVLKDIDLSELADAVRASRLVICGDTGIAHLATAYRTPSVVLFGPLSPSHGGPPPGGLHRVLWCPLPGDSHKHTDGPHPALLRLDAEDVLAAAADLLRT